MNLKTLISTTALAISANTFAVDLASKNTDSYQHIRNATGRLNYAGKTFLIDPMLAEKGRYAGFEGTLNSHLRNPLVELPMKAEDTFKDVKNKINEDSITFKEMDIFDVKKKYNNKYDFINFSNISNYVDTKKFISYIKQLLEDNLYNDGEIILDYIWEYSEKFQSFAISLMDLYELNPNIITFNNNYNGNDAVVVKKKKRS